MAIRVSNRERRFGADPAYVFVMIDGRPALLTEEAVAAGWDRARRNPEDVPGLWARLVHWLGRTPGGAV